MESVTTIQSCNQGSHNGYPLVIRIITLNLCYQVVCVYHWGIWGYFYKHYTFKPYYLRVNCSFNAALMLMLCLTILPIKCVNKLVEESCMSMMDTFEPFTENYIKQLLKRSSNAFCAVDPMPTWFVNDCLAVLISPITNIVNKLALVKPLIKTTVWTIIF